MVDAYKILEGRFWHTIYSKEYHANRIILHALMYVFKSRIGLGDDYA